MNVDQEAIADPAAAVRELTSELVSIKKEATRALTVGINEIRELRRANNEMAGQLRVFEVFANLILPRQGGAMCEDAISVLMRAAHKIMGEE